jgi:hypothetical protein
MESPQNRRLYWKIECKMVQFSKVANVVKTNPFPKFPTLDLTSHLHILKISTSYPPTYQA